MRAYGHLNLRCHVLYEWVCFHTFLFTTLLYPWVLNDIAWHWNVNYILRFIELLRSTKWDSNIVKWTLIRTIFVHPFRWFSSVYIFFLWIHATLCGGSVFENILPSKLDTGSCERFCPNRIRWNKIACPLIGGFTNLFHQFNSIPNQTLINDNTWIQPSVTIFSGLHCWEILLTTIIFSHFICWRIFSLTRSTLREGSYVRLILFH